MKKIISLFLIITISLTFAVLTACTKKEGEVASSGQTETTTSVSTNDETPTGTATVDPTETKVDSNVTSTNGNSTETEPASSEAPLFNNDLPADAQAVKDYAYSEVLDTNESSMSFEMLNTEYGEDGKSCTIQYSLEDEKEIHYYIANLKLSSEGKWEVEKNELHHTDSKG